MAMKQLGLVSGSELCIRENNNEITTELLFVVIITCSGLLTTIAAP